MPVRAVVAPVMIRDRVVNLFYGQVHTDPALGDEAIEGLRRIAHAASNGYVRLIALSKQGT